MYFTFILFAIFGFASANNTGIRNLMGEPDYRRVKLHWDSDAEDEYQVRYCELQSWGAQRCRIKAVPEPENNHVISDENSHSYSVDIAGLRMATTYSFEVKTSKTQGEREDRADGDDKNQNIIVIPTKGFSARATQCLPHASEIEVSTGPYFAGRIAVEAADGERCAIDGEPNSSRDTYTLRINHLDCGSQVNDTTVTTFVIVQENLPILTHSTRRFLVLCSYRPETLTVRAGINLPTGMSGRGHAQSQAVPYEEVNNSLRRGRNLRSKRVLQKPEALVKEEIGKQVSTTNTEAVNPIPLTIVAILIVAGVVGIIAIALKITNKRMQRDLDNVSIGSDVSASSCSTIADVDLFIESNSENKTRI